MKKILVLGALSLFCLSNASAMLTQAIDSQKQEKNDFKVRVTEGGNDKEKSFAEVKLDSISGLLLRELNKGDVNTALTVLSRSGIFMLENTVHDWYELTLEEQYLHILDSVPFKSLEIWPGDIERVPLPILFQALKNNPWLTKFVFRTQEEMSAKEYLDFCLVFKDLPLLEFESDLEIRENLRKVDEELRDVNVSRVWLLQALREYIIDPTGWNVDNFEGCKDTAEVATAFLDKKIFDAHIGNAVSEYQQAFTELESLALTATGQEAKVLLAAEKIRKTAKGNLLRMQYDINRRVEKFIREMTVLVVKMKDVETVEEFQKVMKKTPEELKTAAESWLQPYHKLVELDKKLEARIEAELGVLDPDAEQVELDKIINVISPLVYIFREGREELFYSRKNAKTMEELKTVVQKIQKDLHAEIEIWQKSQQMQVDQKLASAYMELAGMFKQRLEQLVPLGTKEAVINDQKEIIASVMKDFIASVEDQCGIIHKYIYTEDYDERKGIIENTFDAINSKLEAFFMPVDATLQEKMQAAREAEKEEEIRTLEKQLVEFDDARKAAQEKLKELLARARKVFEDNADNAIAKIESFREESCEIVYNRAMKWEQTEEQKI